VSCHLGFKLERLVEDRVQLLVQGAIDEGLMGKSDTPASLGRRAYEAALRKLFLQLATLPVFGAENGPGGAGP
jgi:hypothetical protein